MNIIDAIEELPVIDNHTHPQASFFAGMDDQSLSPEATISLFSMADLQSQMPDKAFRQIQQTADGFRIHRDKLQRYQRFRTNTTFERLQAQARQALYPENQAAADQAAKSPDTDHGTNKDPNQIYDALYRRLNIKKALVNDTELLLQLPGTVLWVPYIDQFVFIKDNTAYKQTRLQLQRSITRYETCLENTKKALGAEPVSFPQFLDFIDAALGHFRKLGCPAMKLHCAYIRSLRFEPVSQSRARTLFDAPQLDAAEYTELQDFMMRFSFRRCIAYDLPVQVHTGIGGPSPGLVLANSNCCNLQNLFIDDELRRLSMVILHGSYPFLREAAYFASNYANVYLDFSWLTFLFQSALARFLEEWLDLVPYSKLLFGTDAWTPELHWCGVTNAKQVLAQVLQNGPWGEKMALEMARAIMHDNAAALYNL